jgi:hypothetical protein
MNEIDVRLAFHMDTGRMPLKEKKEFIIDYEDYESEVKEEEIISYSYRHGIPTSEYGEWLEEKLGNEKLLRKRYFTEEWGLSVKKGYYTFSDTFSSEYCFWLEQIVLAKRRGIVKSIIHI